MRDNLIKTSGIAIARYYVALRCSFVPISPSRSDEGGKGAVIWVQGDTVVSIPAVRLFSLYCWVQTVLGGKGSVCGRFHV